MVSVAKTAFEKNECMRKIEKVPFAHKFAIQAKILCKADRQIKCTPLAAQPDSLATLNK
jgi:hypothetical protein